MVISLNKLINFVSKKIKGYRYFQIVSFSQEGEDLILKRIFNSKNKGFYIDIGAHHPFRFSNTYLFYKKYWNGINIDANPGTKKLFDKYRNRDINIELGISDKKDQLNYYNFREKALNTFSKELADEYISEKWELLNIININTDTLASVLQRILPKNTAIDFMSIDIEGFELKALKSNDWTKYRPKILLIEILNFDVDRFKENLICSYLKEQGYKLIAKTKNTVFFEDNILV